MFLVIDIGNSRQKVAIFDRQGNMVALETYNTLTKCELSSICQSYDIQASIISSVGRQETALAEFLNLSFPTFTFTNKLKLPITLRYGSIDTLGTDRIACAVGANAQYPNQNVLAFQAGTCLVTDFVNDRNEYLGGTIAPGMHLRLDALHHGTQRLPLVEPQPIDFLIGSTTQQSILSGVINGMAAEIDGLADSYEKQFPDLKIILTGGDAPLFQNLIKNSIFAASNLVLYGLYKILYFNVSEI